MRLRASGTTSPAYSGLSPRRQARRALRGEVIACLRYAFPSQVVGKFKNKVCPATIYSWIAETMSWTDEDWKQVEPFVAKARRRSWK
jgi:hypothetical protein